MVRCSGWLMEKARCRDWWSDGLVRCGDWLREKVRCGPIG